MIMETVNMGALAFLAAEIALVAGISLMLFWFRHRIGLGPLYIFIGSNQYLSVVLASTVYVTITPSIAVSPGSAVLFASSLFAILLVYLRTDIPKSRGLIYGIVIANTTLVALLGVTTLQLQALESINLLGVPIEMFTIQPRVFLTGTMVLLIDFFLVVVLYELLFLKVKAAPRLLRILLAMLAVLIFDALVFSFIAFYGQPGFADILKGQLFGKIFAGVLYGLILYFYLTLIEPMRDEKSTDYTDGLGGAFSIITYRERYQVAKQALIAAEAANLAKSRFLSNMSHELRTPLNAIIGFGNVLKNRKQLAADDGHLLQRILVNSKHLLELINGLLDLSKIESGKNELEITSVAIDELIDETVSQLQVQATEKNLELKVEVPERSMLMATDRTRMKQILINLIGNALKFTDSGSVVVRLKSDEKTGTPQQLDILDSGVGIPADQMSEIFKPFHQHIDPKSSAQGTGLGLAIARALCEQLDHSLSATSTEGQGSQFSITFDHTTESDDLHTA